MKPYSEYTAEELAMERLFIRWVREPDEPSVGRFWTYWLAQHPQRAATLDQARVLVEAVSDWPAPGLSGVEAALLWRRVGTSVDWLPDLEGLDPVGWSTPWAARRLGAGIAATGLLVLLWIFWQPVHFFAANSHKEMTQMDSVKVRMQKDSAFRSAKPANP